MKIVTYTLRALLIFLLAAAVSEGAAQSPNNPLPQWVYDTGRKRDEFEKMQRPVPGQQPAARKRVISRERERVLDEERRRIEVLKNPAPEDLETFKDFLALKGTGIAKLYDFSGCRGFTVEAESACSDYFPGAGAYAFRPEATTPDLILEHGLFAPNSFFSHYIISDIGDLDLSAIYAGSSHLKVIEDFAPATTISDARSQYQMLLAGVPADGQTLGTFAGVRLNGTYALRIIAYRCGNDLNKAWYLDRNRGTVDYFHPLFQISKDKRIDMTVVFKVIRIENGSVTIVWKEIARKKAPVLKFRKGDRWGDLQ